jgi:hypothetical protein
MGKGNDGRENPKREGICEKARNDAETAKGKGGG